ncbi:MAG: hypothetical protein ACRD29_10585 [Acidimicrobiales bacterium]
MPPPVCLTRFHPTNRLFVLALATLLVLGLNLVALGHATPRAEASALVPVQEDDQQQDDEETTTTRPEILVPGPSEEDQPTTTAEPDSTPNTEDSDSGSGSGLVDRARSVFADETGRTVTFVIIALLLIALGLAILTVRYWRNTRPGAIAKPAARRRRG